MKFPVTSKPKKLTTNPPATIAMAQMTATRLIGEAYQSPGGNGPRTVKILCVLGAVLGNLRYVTDARGGVRG